MAPLLRSGAVITTNAGAANPVAAAAAVKELAVGLGVEPVVAAVIGDDVLDVLDLRSSEVMGTDSSLWELRDRVVSANAYMGAESLLDALTAGADVVVAGRCSDTALFVAPLAHHFGRSLDDLDWIAQATLVGHLLECGGQLSGGYFADADRKKVDGLWNLGFPLAEVQVNGTATYTKLPGTGGLIDRRTVLEQLLYEVDDPTSYLTPDVAVDFSAVSIHDHGSDRVTVEGARSNGLPERLKVSVGIRDGLRAIAEISYAGDDCIERAALAAEIVTTRWKRVYGYSVADLSVSSIGLDSTRPWHRPADTIKPPEVRLRFSLRTFDRKEATLLCEEVESLYTNGPSGGGGVTTAIRETVGLVSTFIDRDAVRPEVVFS